MHKEVKKLALTFVWKGQLSVIIWANKRLMLYAKFQQHRPVGSEEEDFLKIFTI